MKPMFCELQVVRLVCDLKTPKGLIPKKSDGVVLQVVNDGQAYEIDFDGVLVPEIVPVELLEASPF